MIRNTNINAMKKNKILAFLFCMMAFLGSFGVLKYRGTSLFILIQLVTVLYCVLIYKKVYFPLKAVRNIYICLFISAFLAQFSSMPQSYKSSAVYITVLLVPSYLCIGYLYRSARDNLSYFRIIRSALRVMCVVQLVWCVIELMTYRVTGIDLNDLIFVKILHTVNDASYFKLNQFMPTGFSHHPAVMAPIVVLAFFMFESPISKVIICVIGFCITNSTAVLGVCLCILYEMSKTIKNKSTQIKKKRLFQIFVIICFGVFLVLATKAYEPLIDLMKNLYSRIFVSGYDSSSNAHKRYFTSYPDVISISSLPQILFGYGEGCSGYPFGVLFNQYTFLGNWSVESTVMDYLISRGIVGFIVSYFCLIRIALKGKKINKKYTVCMLIWILQGITYQIQFDWLFFIEMVFYLAASLNYDIFQGKEEN